MKKKLFYSADALCTCQPSGTECWTRQTLSCLCGIRHYKSHFKIREHKIPWRRNRFLESTWWEKPHHSDCHWPLGKWERHWEEHTASLVLFADGLFSSQFLDDKWDVTSAGAARATNMNLPSSPKLRRPCGLRYFSYTQIDQCSLRTLKTLV